jgi:transcriptional regulator GlxA family with amidase domain
MQKTLELAIEAAGGKRMDSRRHSLAKRVREVLLSFGGEAHRTLVIEQVAKSLGHDARQIPEELQQALIVSFEEYRRDERKRAAYGFHLPFGEGSHRWALMPVTVH